MGALTEAKPTTLPVLPENIPAELKQYDQWVAWQLTLVKGEWTKVPYNPFRDEKASSTNPKTWGTFQEVFAEYRLSPDKWNGVGFACADDPFVVFDLDHCRDPISGEIESWAMEIVRRLDTYTEVSPSGTGLRLIAKGSLPPRGRRKGNIEVYDNKRYVTITGHHLPGTPTTINDRAGVIPQIHAETFGKQEDTPKTPTTGSAGGNGYCPTDQQVLDKLAAHPDESDKIRRLQQGDASLWTGTKKLYPSQSEADFGYIGYLKYFTGDADQIERLARQTALARPKWDEMRGSLTWLLESIRNALENRTECFDWGEDEQPQPATPEDSAEQEGTTEEPPTDTEPDTQHTRSKPPDNISTAENKLAYLNYAFRGEYGQAAPIVKAWKTGREKGRYRLSLEDGTQVPLGTATSVLSVASCRAAFADATGGVVIHQAKKTWPKVAHCIFDLAELQETGTVRSEVGEMLQRFFDQCAPFATASEHECGTDEWKHEKFRAFGRRYSYHGVLGGTKGDYGHGALQGPDNVLWIHFPSFYIFAKSIDAEIRRDDLKEGLTQLGFQANAELYTPGGKAKTRAWASKPGFDPANL